jgi:hypothetical protein
MAPRLAQQRHKSIPGWHQELNSHGLSRVYQPNFLSGRTKPLAGRSCLILPLMLLPAPYRLRDGLVHILRRPALALHQYW